MKTRSGFVSNSSSASFIIKKEGLLPVQIALIKDVYKTHAGPSVNDCWSISETETEIFGSTAMDNGDMMDFLKWVNIPLGNLEWES